MINKFRYFALAAVAMLLLSTCEMDIATDINLSVIPGLTGSTETAYLSATINFQNPSDESRSKIIEIMNAYFFGVSNIRVEQIGSSDALVADIKVPVNLIKEDSVNAETPFQVSVYDEEDRYEVFFQLNKDSWADLNKDVYELTYQKLNITETGISFTITNDLQRAGSLYFASVYVNGIPIPYSEAIALEKKQSLEVVFSNVLQDMLSIDEFNQIRIFSLMK